MAATSSDARSSITALFIADRQIKHVAHGEDRGSHDIASGPSLQHDLEDD
jgi:hypothetical protein